MGWGITCHTKFDVKIWILRTNLVRKQIVSRYNFIIKNKMNIIDNLMRSNCTHAIIKKSIPNIILNPNSIQIHNVLSGVALTFLFVTTK